MSIKTSGIFISLLAAGALSVVVVPAQAAPDSAESVAELIGQVRPDTVTNERVSESSDGWTTHDRDVVIPKRSDQVVRVGGDTGVAVTLPGDGAKGRVARDGTVVYGKEDGVQVAVQADDTGTRIHTVFDSKKAVDDVTYALSDVTPELESDGSVTLYRTSDDGSIQVSVAYVEAPWAADAKGKALETEYRVEGNAIVQEVTTTKDTVFPVVSDPRFQGDCGIITCTVRFDRARSKSLGNYGGDYNAVITLLAAGIGSLGGPPAAIALGALGALAAARVTTLSKQAKDFYGNGNCFGYKFTKLSTAAGWGTQVKKNTFNCQ